MKKICLNTDKKYTGFYINKNKFMFLYKDKIDEYDNDLKYINTIKLDNSYDSMSYNNNIYLSKDNNIYIKEDNINLLDIKIEENINSLNFYQKKLIVCDNKIYLLNGTLHKLIEDTLINNLLNNDLNNKIHCAISNNDNLYVVYNNDNKIYISNIKEKIIINKHYLGKNIIVYNGYFYNDKLYLLVESNNKEYLYIIEECNDYNNCLELIKCLCFNNCNDIPASIAMIEKSIAKILDIEAQKIQKTISITCNINELLEVNDSVNEVIRKITFLEQVLCSKLEIYQNIIKEINKCKN